MNIMKNEARQKGLPVIAGLWVGSDLSWVEQVCIKSYIDNGHRFVLYLVDDILGIPNGVDVRHANEIFYPPPFNIKDNDRQRVAVYSDIFRLHLLFKTNYIWADLDAYCVQAFDFPGSFVFSQLKDGTVPTGIIRLPKNSETLRAMLDFVSMPNPVQPWRGPRLHRISKKRTDNNEKWGIEALAWACSGPKAFAYFLNETNEISHAMDANAFYPLFINELWKLHVQNFDISLIEKADVYSVHIYGLQKKIIANRYSGLPISGSYLDKICTRHEIDPKTAILEPLQWM